MDFLELSIKLRQFERYFLDDFKSDPYQNHMALFGGRSGVLLTNSVLCQNNPCLDRHEYIDKNIEFIINYLESEEGYTSKLSSGICGVGFSFDYIQNNSLSTIDLNYILIEMDSFIAEEIYKYIHLCAFDPLHGAIGLGLYLINRNKHKQAVESLIIELDRRSIRIGNQYVWKRYDKYHSKKFIYDYGLAHGNAGIMYFLGKAYQNNILPHICLKLIKGLKQFYIEKIQNPISGSLYPYSVLTEKSTKPTQKFSRLAWCYGDIGILFTLYNISIWTKDRSLCDFAISNLLRTTERKTQKETQVIDACFCHGTSGLAYIYYKLYKLTNIADFKVASSYWLRKTIEYGNQTGNISQTGYLFQLEDSNGNSTIDFPSLLEGSAGVAIIIAQISSNKLSNWDKVFFLS